MTRLQRYAKDAFESFAIAHPHECYAKWPERFWRFFQKRAPGVSRERMEQLLKESDHETTN